MVAKLLDEFPGYQFILDTSAGGVKGDIGPSRWAYHGSEGINAVNPSTIQVAISRINWLESLARNRKVIVIEETVKEMQAGLRAINENASALKEENDPLYDKTHSHRDRIGKFHKKMSGASPDAVANLILLGRTMYGLIRACSNKDARSYFTESQKNAYQRYFDRAECFSRDLKRRSLELKSWMKSPVTVREDLETDSHIIATALTNALQYKTAIVTRDNGISCLLARMRDSIADIYDPKNQGLRIPGRLPALYNPDDSPMEETLLIPNPSFIQEAV